MNEEALRVLYGLAQGDGYKKSFNEFKTLMSENSEAVSTMYVLAQKDGYKKSRGEFNTLVGFEAQPEKPKKKDESTSTATEEVSVSESQQPQETTTSGTSQPAQVQLPQFDTYEADVTRVDQPRVTFDQPEFGRRELEPLKPYDPFEVTPLQADVARVDQPRLVVDTDPMSEITKTIGQIEPVEEQQTFAPSPISRPRVAPQMVAPTLTEQDIADLDQSRREQAEAEARTKFIELAQPDAEEIIQPEAAPADATRVVGPDLVIPEEREITIQELAGRQAPSAPSRFEPAAVDATFSQTAADIAKIDASEEGIQKRIEEEEREFAEEQLKRQMGIFSLEDNTIIEDVFGKNTVTNFIGDIYRAAGQGQAQGAVVDDAIALMRKGPNATDADIMQFIEAYNRMVESGSSDEMRDFNKVYEESGGGLVGFWNGFKSNPTVFPQLFVSSASAMINPASIAAGVAAAGPGFLVGGPGGALVTAITGSATALEAALTYAELLQEEIGLYTPMTIENVRAVLSQPGVQDRLTWKATGRGLTIGAIEGLTSALGVKATSLITGRTGSKLVGGLTGTAVEGAGGATGEFLGRKVAGQADDFLEVAFEGTVGGLTTAPITVGMGIRDAMTKGQYKINDGVATKEQVVSLLETGTDADIAGTKLDIQNDPELRKAAEDAKARIRNNAEIKAELAQAGVTDNNKIDAIVPLEVEKQGLSGNTTEAGKRRLKEINDQINSILDEPTAVTTETEAVRIYEGKDKDGNTKQVKLTTQEDGRIRLDIINDDGSTALIGDFPAESTDTDVVSGIIDTEQDFNIVKPQDAIQEPSTETVDVQEPTRDSEAVGERDATGPVTTEGEAEVQVEETPLTVREEAADLAAMVGEELQAPAPTTEAAPAVEETANSFQKAGQESKEKGDGKILGQWILDNAKEGDRIVDKDGNGYEVTQVERNGNVVITPFELNENGEVEYNPSGLRLVSNAQLKQGDLFQYSFTDNEGNTVIEQYSYQAAPTIAETTTEAAPAVTEEATVAEEAEVETYTLPETIKERKQDFEIIDNRGEKAGLEIDEDGSGRWYVENKKTGSIADFRTKSEAQEGIRNPDWDYGEGAPIITEETTVAEEAAPVAEEKATTEETTVTEEAAPVAELTAQQREFITEDDAGINGLAYNPTYIGTVWNNIIDVLGDKSFTSLFKKHINEDFTSSMIEGELEEFSSTMIDLDDGMQKFIDLVNDANKRIKRKGGNQINLMPLERTAPSSEALIEIGMTDENTKADFKRFEQEYKDKNPFQVDPFNDEKTNDRKQARDAKAKQYAQEQVKKMLQESKAPTKPAPAPKAAPVTEQAAPKDKTQSEIDELNADIERNESSVISLKEEIEIEKGNIKDQKERIDKEVQDIKKSGERQFAKTILLEELKEEKRQAIEDHKDLLEDYRQQIKQLNSDIKKDKNKVKKLEASIAKAPAKPKPTTTKAAPVAELTDEQAKKVKENQAEIERLESELSDSQRMIEDVEAEIESQQGIISDELKNFDAEIAKIKDLDISSKEKANRRDDIKRQREDYMQKQNNLLGRFMDDQMGYAADIGRAERKIKKLKADNEKLGAPIAEAPTKPKQAHIKVKDVDLNDYELVRYIEPDRNYGKLYRKIKPAPKEGVSLYVEEGSKVYLDINRTLRPKGGKYGKMAGIYMSDIMLEPVSPAPKTKPTPAPKAKPTPAPKAKPAPAPKVEPVAKGVDPFYDSVEAQQKQEERIGKLADRARTAIKKVLPDAKIILHRTEAEYNKATKANSKGSQGGAGSRGVLIGDTIHVNMPHANDRTIAHEVFHALLTNLSKENSVDVINLTKKMAASLKGKIKDKEILAELDGFVDQYSGEVQAIQAEEMVAEFMGILAERYNSLDKPAKSLVQRFLERLADLLGLSKTFVPKAGTRKGQLNTVNLLETLAGKVATGQQIIEEDIVALIPYKDGQPDFQAAPDNLTVQEIDDMAMEEIAEYERKVQEKMLSPIEQILFYEDVKVTRDEYIANRGKPDGKPIRYANLFTTEPGVDVKAEELSGRYRRLITEEDIFNYIDARADTKGKFTEKNLKFLRDNDLLELGQRFDKAPKSPKQQMAELAEDYNINVKGFLSFQINDGILRPKLRKLGYELRRHSTGFTIRDANDRMYRPPTGRGAGRKFQLFGGKDANIAEIVNIARESNINRQATKEFLMSNRGLTAKQADKLLDVSTDNMYTVPVSFGNIGLRDGIVLFEKVANYADKIAKDKKVKVMDRLPMTLEFLEKQPEYIAQADKKTKGPSTIQMQMQSDVQKALGLKKTANMSERLKAFNEKVRQRKKGARDLKATQRDLRNFIRQALPEGVYKKPDVVRMMSDITKLKPQDESNMQKITDDVIKRVTKMQVEFLQKKIDSILNGKYDTVQSGRKKGRKIDPDTKNRFKLRIKPFLLGPDATLEDVLSDNQSYYSRISELDNKLNRSILEDETMLNLMAIIHLNESLLYNNDEVNKVEALQKAEDILSGILGEGIQAFKQLIQQRKETKMANASMIFEDSIGLELNEDNIEQFSNMKDFQPKVNRKKLKNRMARKFDDAIKSTYNSIRSFMQAEESLEGLIDRIMEAPGAAIGGKTLEFVYGGINEASRTFKENLMKVKEFTIEDLNKSFGKNKWQKAVSEGTVKDFTGVYVDPKQVEEARAEYKKNPTEKNKRKFDFIEAKNNIELSENEIAFLWAQYQDPANKASFENPDNDNFGPDHKRIMDELVATINPGHLKFAKLMANKMQSRYKVYNDSYRKIYLSDMPFNGFYAGRIYREGVDDRFSIDLMGDYEKMMKVVSAQSQKVRSNTTRPIKPVDLYNNMSNYYTDMEWAAAYGPTMKEINDAFNVPAVKQAIEYVGGKDLLGYINDVFERIATKGIDTQKNTGMLNFMNDFFVGTRLGLNPTIALKQLTSIPTYADAIGPKNWFKNSSFANIGDIKRTWKEVMDNSVYLKDRVSEDFRRTVANYTTEQSKDIIPFLSKNKFQNALMFFGKAGDIGAIYLGGLPNYRYYKSEFRNKNPNATEQEVIDYAIRKFEKDTKTTQQSNDIQDKSYTQSSNAFMRGINMFKTTPKQYLRKEFAGIRKMRRAYRDQGFTSTDFWRGARQFAMFHSIMPATFQYVAMGLPGLLSDFDDEDGIDIIRAVLLGNVNGLFLIGDVLNGLVDAGLGKPYAGNLAELPLTDEVNELIKYYGWMNRSSKQKTKEKWGNKFYVRLFELVVGAGARKVGLPVLPLYNMQQYYSNLEKAADAKTGGEVVQRVLGYTDYVIEGSKKGGSSGASTGRGTKRGGTR